MNKVIFVLLLTTAVFSFKISDILAEIDPFYAPDPPLTVANVNLQQYLGSWYQQADIPFFFERDCVNVIATYSLNPNGTIKVNNTCTRNGKEVYAVGHAVPADSTNSKLKVYFSETFDVPANYWIVMLDADYTYAVISSPNYRYLWILYRQPVMPEALYQQIISNLQAAGGYQVDKLVKTPQNQ